MNARQRPSLKSFWISTRGSILVEFALMVPILTSILVGSNELARMVRASQHIEDYATMVANDVSTAASGLSAGTLRELIERIGLVAPELVDPTLSAWNPSATDSSYLGVGISMAMATVAVSGCHLDCTYNTDLSWTFGSVQRACGLVTMPTGANIPGPVVIVDVKSTYRFAFDFAGRLGIAPTLTRSIYMPVKNWQNAGLVPFPAPISSGGWNTNVCE